MACVRRLRTYANNSRSFGFCTISHAAVLLTYTRKAGLADKPHWQQLSDAKARNLIGCFQEDEVGIGHSLWAEDKMTLV